MQIVYDGAMTDQLDFSEAELLATASIEQPLFASGKRCHGGFDQVGNYVSPRTEHRWRAIRNWQDEHRRQSGNEILDAPLSQWPAQFPSVAQTKYLLREGVTQPTAASLTRIGTVEGFGGLIRDVGVEDLQSHFADSIAHTALAHLDRGLFEAHARDEVGHGEEAGHKEMWFATRDIAFDRSFGDDEVAQMIQRMGFAPAAGGATPAPVRLCPEIEPGLEGMLRFMIGLMFIEVSAFHTFAWAEAVLRDRDLVAGDGTAADLVSYIRADETPHVAYLQTALTEVRDRSLRTTSGAAIDGVVIVDRIWAHALNESLGSRRELQLAATVHEIEFAVKDLVRGEEILQQFNALATV